MRVLTNLVILGDQDSVLTPGGRHDDLVGGVTLKRLWQCATFHKHRPSQFGEMKTRHVRRRIEPLIEGPIEHELFLINLLG